jgi:hypothetical protein
MAIGGVEARHLAVPRSVQNQLDGTSNAVVPAAFLPTKGRAPDEALVG